MAAILDESGSAIDDEIPAEILDEAGGGWVFSYTEPLIYDDYIDTAAGHTLLASPGGTYSMMVASGRNPGLTVPPADGRWTAG